MLRNNASCPRSPMAIVSINLVIHAHSNKEALERVQVLLNHGLTAPAPKEAVAASTFKDLVEEFKVSEPVWCEHAITEEEAKKIKSKPGDN